MPSYFSANALKQLAEGFETTPRRAQAVAEIYLNRQYISEAAKEYAHHGVARRISTLARCIAQICRHIPPELDEVPDRDVRIDATIFIQTFVFNAFGVLDNLAFVWVNEKNVLGRNGRPLPNGRVGLTADKDQVRQSFSAPMRAYLQQRDPWFSYLEGFRHSLGHRIPLYIPPHVVDPADVPQYQALEASIHEALRNCDVEAYQALKVEQAALARFRPWMKHSLTDPTPPVIFHSQVLSDFATIEEMCLRIRDELDARTQ